MKLTIPFMFEKSKHECTCMILHMIEYPENFICIFMCPNFNFTIIWKCNLNVNLELLVSSNREYI